MKNSNFLFAIIFSTAIWVLADDSNNTPVHQCRQKHEANHENIVFDRDLLPEQNNYDIQFYGLDVTIDVDTETIDGTVEIVIKSKVNNLTEIILDAADHLIMDIISSENLNSHSHTDNRLILEFSTPIHEGNTKSIEIEYHGGTGTGVAWEGGLVYSNNQVYSLNCPYGMSDWIPCKDHPSDKADSMDIKVTLPEHLIVASNGKLQEVLENEDGTHTHHWKESHPIATYLFNISAGVYYVTTNEITLSGITMPIIYYNTVSTVPSGFYYVEEALPIFSDLFGIYPFVDEKYAINRVYGGGWAMEHQNNVTTATSNGMTQVHELGHQWFGDKVTVRDWQHGWLNEGFATYCEALYMESTQGETAYHSYMNNMQWGWNDNESVFTTDTIGVWDIFDIIIYYKGAWVNHMLRHVVGDSTYFSALRDYLEIYAYGNVVTEDLQGVMENHHGSDLDWFFGQWIYGHGHPEYEYIWAGNPSMVKLKINQVSTSNNPELFTMPLDVQFSDGDHSELITIWVEDAEMISTFSVNFHPTQLALDPDGWVLGEFSGSGIGIFGDSTQDSAVNILDIINTINYILGQTEFTEEQFFLGDMADFGAINILDIIALVNLILDLPI